MSASLTLQYDMVMYLLADRPEHVNTYAGPIISSTSTGGKPIMTTRFRSPAPAGGAIGPVRFLMKDHSALGLRVGMPPSAALGAPVRQVVGLSRRTAHPVRTTAQEMDTASRRANLPKRLR